MAQVLLMRLWGSPRTRALRMLWQASRAMGLLAALFVVAEGALPVVVLIAMGRVVAAIPGAVAFGISSPHGHTLLVDLAEAGAVYALSLMRGPFEDALTAASSARVDALMQRRLVAAVCAPAGIEHLEDESVLDRLSSARGELLTSQPSGAPMQLVSNLGDRLEAWKPPASKEVRVFELGDWIADRHAGEWLEGMEPSWREARRLNTRIWIVGAFVLAAFALAAGTLGWTADHHEISLRTLATLLPMLPTSMSTGSVTINDITLEQMLSGLPDLDSLTAELHHAAGAEDGVLPAAGLPARRARFEGVGFSYPGRPRPVLADLELEIG